MLPDFRKLTNLSNIFSQTGTTHAQGASKRAIRSSLVPHAVLLMTLWGHSNHKMHPRSLTALGKSHL